MFEYNGSLDEDAVLCLAMYESDKLPAGDKSRVTDSNPTVKFDNKSTLSNNKLMLVNKNVMHKHEGTKVEQMNATCIAASVKAYYKCSCGRFYTDSACTKEIADLDVWKNDEGKIDEEAHEYGTKWITDKTNHWHVARINETSKH